MVSRKSLEKQIDDLQEFIYENSFFLRYLAVTLEKYNEDPCTAIHDYTCPLNDPRAHNAHKVYDRTKGEWAHPPDLVDERCNCKIRAVIDVLYEIKQYQKDKAYVKMINEIKESRARERALAPGDSEAKRAA